MAYKKIIYEVKGHIGYIILNRPEVFNAIDAELISEFRNALSKVKEDENIRVLILTGAGKAFQAGADIKELSKMNTWELHKWNHDVLDAFKEVEKLRCPVIAAINGFALGGGLELSISCDIRIAAENAQLGVPEVYLGIIPGAGGTQRLTRIIGQGKTSELLFTGKQINAQEALGIGLINKVVPKGEALQSAEDMAEEILKNAPLAVMLAKDAVIVGKDLPLDAAIEYGHKNVLLSAASQDAQEGFNAFIGKVKPKWRSK